MLAPRPTHVRHTALIAEFTRSAQPRWAITGTTEFGYGRFLGPDGTLSARTVEEAFLFTTEADALLELGKYAGAELTKVYLPPTFRQPAMTLTRKSDGPPSSMAKGSVRAQAKRQRRRDEQLGDDRSEHRARLAGKGK